MRREIPDAEEIHGGPWCEACGQRIGIAMALVANRDAWKARAKELEDRNREDYLKMLNDQLADAREELGRLKVFLHGEMGVEEDERT